MDYLYNIVSFLSDGLWTYILLVLLIIVGVMYTFGLQFIQLRYLGKGLKLTFSKGDSQHESGVSLFESIATAIGGCVGTGNIVGVTTAVMSGGPGALFWMWILAFFGMAIKYVEGYLGAKFGQEKEGEILGGPMYYIDGALGPKYRFLSVMFAVCCASVGIVSMGTQVQGDSIMRAVESAWMIPKWVTGIALAALILSSILGGIKRIAKWSSILVPFMALAYIFLGLAIIFMNLGEVGQAFKTIFHFAFASDAVGGGITGFTVAQAMRYGFARGVFSNEAGAGTGPLIMSSSGDREPHKQGLGLAVTPFIDTILICTVTGLVIVMTMGGTMDQDIQPYERVLNGMSSLLHISSGGILKHYLAVSLIFFAFTTMLAWVHQIYVCLMYLLKGKKSTVKNFLFLMPIFIVITPFLKLDFIWKLSDFMNGLSVLPNVLALIFLYGYIKKEQKEGKMQ